MRNFRLRRAATVLLTLSMLAGLQATFSPSAQAHDFAYHCSGDVICQTGVRVTGGIAPLDECFGSDDQRIEVCVRKYGDYIFVRDKETDGWGAVAIVSRRDFGGYVRKCRNPYGAGTWARCNFNWSEGHRWWVRGDEYRHSDNTWRNAVRFLNDGEFYD